MSFNTTIETAEGEDRQVLVNRSLLGFALLWSRDEPYRMGEICLMPSSAEGTRAVLGRGESAQDNSLPLLQWMRQQPGRSLPTGALTSPRISRTQLQVEVSGARALRLTNVGRCPLLHEGREVSTVDVSPGELIELRRAALFLCIERPRALPAPEPPLEEHPFGEPDAHGLVGESPSAWALRARIAFVARRGAHVLVQGPSGAGKELVAHAIHRLSQRGRRPLVSRNAATFPESLIDVELFGNARGFPNPGTPERPGLVGEADGSTLLLDEFAELPQAMQAHLLRVLDSGEYTRLGEARPRRSDFRLIAATNRPESALKHDVLARLHLRIDVPGLNERREDIPLLAQHLLRRMAREDPELARRFFPGGDPSASPQIDAGLVARLTSHRYTTHARELEALLWRAIAESHDGVLTTWTEASAPSVAHGAPTPDEPEDAAGDTPEVPPKGIDPLSIPPEVIQSCLDRHGGQQEPVWRELGLSSRHVLTRLVRRYQLKVRGRG